MAEAGVEVDPAWVVESTLGIEFGAEAAQALMGLTPARPRCSRSTTRPRSAPYRRLKSSAFRCPRTYRSSATTTPHRPPSPDAADLGARAVRPDRRRRPRPARLRPDGGARPDPGRDANAHPAPIHGGRTSRVSAENLPSKPMGSSAGPLLSRGSTARGRLARRAEEDARGHGPAQAPGIGLLQ